MMTQKQAWKYLAKLWNKAEYSNFWISFCVYLPEDSFPLRGLCACVCFLQKYEKISIKTYDQMNAKINKKLDSLNSAWLTNDKTIKGAKIRRDFCLKQFKELDRK